VGEWVGGADRLGVTCTREHQAGDLNLAPQKLGLHSPLFPENISDYAMALKLVQFALK